MARIWEWNRPFSSISKDVKFNFKNIIFTLGHLPDFDSPKDFAQKRTFLLYSEQNSYNLCRIKICISIVAPFFSLFWVEKMLKFSKMNQFIWRSEIREMHSSLLLICSIFNEIRSKNKISQFLLNFHFLHLASWRQKNDENWWKKSQKCHFTNAGTHL